MLQLFPFVAWLPAAVSATMTVMLWNAGELPPWGLAIAALWLLGAAACQFFAPSPAIAAVALVLQTLLAIGLIVRWKFTTP